MVVCFTSTLATNRSVPTEPSVPSVILMSSVSIVPAGSGMSVGTSNETVSANASPGTIPPLMLWRMLPMGCMVSKKADSRSLNDCSENSMTRS